MKIQKQLGSLRFEVNMTFFRTIVIAAWIFLVLIVPISIDQYAKQQDAAAADTQIEDVIPGTKEGFFNYTVDLSDQKSLVSSLTLLVGAISAALAVGSIVYFLLEHRKKNNSVFDN